MSIKGKAAITGFAEMRPQKDADGRTPLGIMATVAREAIADAGLEKKDIDGLLTGWAMGEYSILWPSVVVEYLHLQPRYFNQVELGGASAAGMVWRAAAAIEAGMCNTVLCVVGDTRRVSTPGRKLPQRSKRTIFWVTTASSVSPLQRRNPMQSSPLPSSTGPIFFSTICRASVSDALNTITARLKNG